MLNEMEIQSGPEMETRTHTGPFSWLEIIIMTVLVTISIVLS